MSGVARAILILAVAALAAVGGRLGYRATASDDPAPSSISLDTHEERAERRHRELLIRIESLRRQMLALHGKRFVEER